MGGTRAMRVWFARDCSIPLAVDNRAAPNDAGIGAHGQRIFANLHLLLLLSGFLQCSAPGNGTVSSCVRRGSLPQRVAPYVRYGLLLLKFATGHAELRLRCARLTRHSRMQRLLQLGATIGESSTILPTSWLACT